MGHAGCKTQDSKGYRDQKEVEIWGEKCPVMQFQNLLFKENILTPEGLSEMETHIAQEIDEAFTFARRSPLPTHEDLYMNLYCE
jgi:pyruvate dehydrogenase E1 component alpha subunit